MNYLILYFFTLILTLNHKAIPNRFFFLTWFSVMAFFSLTLRLTGIDEAPSDSDIGSYVMNMKITEYVLGYHLREFIFWLGSRYLYQLIQDPALVFFVMDLVLFYFFYKSVSTLHQLFPKYIQLENVKYLYFGAFLFFPYIAGFNNTYRFILSVPFALYAIGLAKNAPVKSIGYFFISIFIHNSCILLFPILVLVRGRYHSKLLASLISCLLVIAMYMMDTFSSSFFARSDGLEIGQKIALIYLCTILLITFFIVFFEYIAQSKINSLFLSIMIYMLIMYFSAYLFMTSLNAQRVFFLFLALLYPMLGFYIETRFKSGFYTRVAYSHIALLPLLYFQ